MTGLPPDKIDKLVDASEKVNESSRRLALAMVAHQERARLARRRFLITILVIVIGFGGLYWRQDSQNQNIIDGRNVSRSVLRQIADCLDQNGKCAKDSAANTAALIAKLLQAQQQIAGIAAACAPDYVNLPRPARDQAILKCIVTGLATH